MARPLLLDTLDDVRVPNYKLCSDVRAAFRHAETLSTMPLNACTDNTSLQSRQAACFSLHVLCPQSCSQFESPRQGNTAGKNWHAQGHAESETLPCDVAVD